MQLLVSCGGGSGTGASGGNPVAIDSDGDGVPDPSDAFPSDSSEWEDSEGDSIGDNSQARYIGGAIPSTESKYDSSIWRGERSLGSWDSAIFE
jgi:hypothetical protein